MADCFERIDLAATIRSKNRTAKNVSCGLDMNNGSIIDVDAFRPADEMKQPPLLPPPPELLELLVVLGLKLSLQAWISASSISTQTELEKELSFPSVS